jgi:polysaccharide pyruvyl transferase WcaK-like protein
MAEVSARPVRVLILNQHGDNRGDEAALRAMLAGIEARAPGPVSFTVLHQFRGGVVYISVPHDLQWISLVPNLVEAGRLALCSALFALGLRWKGALGPWGRSVIDAYERADIALSAPGGPYFGDLYASHELVHWLYIWLAHRHRLPTMLYAPSVGPFRKRLRNPLRRWLFSTFRTVALREPFSVAYLTGLFGTRRGADPRVGSALSPILVTDSAVQRPLPAYTRAEYFGATRSALAERVLVAVSVLDWGYPGHADPAAAKARYEQVVLEALVHLHRRHSAHLLLAPQLYGAVHTDVPFLRGLIARLPSDVSWELVDPEADSDHQQRVFGMADIYFASRYHPQIFAINGGVPGVCIYYQHKALGFLTQCGLERFAFPIDNLDGVAVRAALDEAIERRAELRAHIAAALPALRAASARSSELVVELLPR